MYIQDEDIQSYSASEREAEAREREHAALTCDNCGNPGSHTHPLAPCANVACGNYVGECVDQDSIEAVLGVCCEAGCAVIAVRDLREMLRRAERRAA